MNTHFLRFSTTKQMLIATTALLLLLTGCSTMGSSKKDDQATIKTDSSRSIVENAPYYPTEFKDLLIPGELKWNRDKTMSIRTASYAGGILNFSGRVEINSLSDFFVQTMQKNGWKLNGTIKYKEILLAFTKPNKTCMLKISEGDFVSMSTEVFVYITDDISAVKTESYK